MQEWDEKKESMADDLILTRQEFFVLAMLAGKDKFLGFAPKEEDLSENAVGECLFHMVQEGFLETMEEGVRMQEELQEMFRIVAKSRRVLTVYFQDRELPRLCMYPAGEVVNVRESEKNEDCLIVEKMSPEEAAADLARRPELPGGELPSLVLGEPEETEGQVQFQSADALLEKEEVRMLLDLVDGETAEVLARSYLLEEGLYPQLIFQEKTRCTQGYYSRERLKIVICRLLGETGRKSDREADMEEEMSAGREAGGFKL